MTRLHILVTKEFHNHRAPLKDLRRRSMGPQTPWPPCRPRKHGDITAYLLSDLPSIASPRSSMDCIVLFYLLELLLQSSVGYFIKAYMHTQTGQSRGQDNWRACV